MQEKDLVKIKQEATARMKELAATFNDDPEVFHKKADGLICKTLEELGFDDLIQAYTSCERWYG